MAHHGGQFHGKSSAAHDDGDEDDEEDPFDTRIQKSGCAEFHYALQVNMQRFSRLVHVFTVSCLLR